MSSFKSIRDKALDVDPDLRFMALEDFKTKLEPNNGANIEKFVDILFKLLTDQNPDVKSQTIKLFPSVLPYVSNKKVIEIIGTLFNQVIQSSENPVPLMVLKLVFNSNSNATFKFSITLSRAIIDMVLPSIVSSGSSINNQLIEILIELVKNFNQSLSLDEFLNLTTYLISLSFQQVSNSIGKKSIFAFNLLLSSGSFKVDNDIFDSILTTINMNFDQHSPSFVYNYNKLELIFTLVKNLDLLGDLSLNDSIVDELSSTVNENLNRKLEDLDYDQILEDNLIKRISLDILIHILPYNIDPTEAIEKFFFYNPIKSDDDEEGDDDCDVDDDDDVTFSDDDEMENEIQDFDDGSWKLRLKAIVLVKKTGQLKYMPKLLVQIDDKNEFIFKQAIITINSLINPDCQHLIPDIETKILKNLNNENLLIFGSLIETILKQDLKLSDEFVIEFLQFLQNNIKNFELNEVLNLISLMVEKIDSKLLITVNKSLMMNLSALLDKNSTIIYSNLKILNQLTIRLPASDNDIILKAIVDKLLNDPKLLIDLKIELINSLTLYVLYNELTGDQLSPVFNIFEENLNSELMVKPLLVNLNQIFDGETCNVNYQRFIEHESFSNLLTNKLKLYLNSNNKSIYYLVLNLFKKLNFSIDSCELLLFGIKEYQDSKTVNLVFENLNLNMPTVDESFLTQLIGFVNMIDDPEIDIEPLICQICNQGNYFEFFKTHLNFNRLLSVRILALLTINLQLQPEIEANELKLNQLIDQNLFTNDFLKVLQYLSFVNLSNKLQNVDLNKLFDLLITDINESIKFEISKNLGYLIKDDTNLLIERFNQENDDNVKYYFFNTIKYYLKSFDNKEFETKFWKLLLDEVNINSIKKEFTLIGETLSMIALRNNQLEEILNLLLLDVSNQTIGLSYTLLIMVNHFIKTIDDMELINKMVLTSIKYFEIVDVEIKIILVKNLINLFYRFPELVNENISLINKYLFEELKPYDEFKKVIPMGPYKYVIDEGLEIRKLVFELIYSIINNDVITKDYNELITQLVIKGLVDNEFDIVNLCYTSLSKLINNYPEYLNDSNNLNILIENLNKNLNKKLKSKATAQEIEVFQESLKSLINVSNQINNLLTKYNWSYNSWDIYFNTVKKFGDVN